MPVKFKFNECLILRSMGANDKKEDTLAELYSTVPRSTLIEVYKKYWFDYEMFGYDFNQVLELGGYKSLTELEKSEILLKFPEFHRKHNYHSAISIPTRGDIQPSNFSQKSAKQPNSFQNVKIPPYVHRKKNK